MLFLVKFNLTKDLKITFIIVLNCLKNREFISKKKIVQTTTLNMLAKNIIMLPHVHRQNGLKFSGGLINE